MSGALGPAVCFGVAQRSRRPRIDGWHWGRSLEAGYWMMPVHMLPVPAIGPASIRAVVCRLWE